MASLSDSFVHLFHQFNTLRSEPLFKTAGANKTTATGAADTIIQGCEKLLDEIRELSLFSPNELLEDITTSSTQFLLLPFMIGTALEAGSDINGRIEKLRKAKINYDAFIQTTCHFGREISGFEKVLTLFNAQKEQQPRLSPGDQRTQLIERRHHVKDIDSKIERVCMDLGQSNLFKSDDEAELRSLWTLILERCLFDALANMDMIDREMPMLIQYHDRLDKPYDSTLRLDGDGALLTKPFILKINNTAELVKHYRDRVFKPGYILPSISLAQAADAELEMEGRRLANAQKSTVTHYMDDGYCTCEGECDAPHRPDDEDDAIQLKARRWDDWKDENPRGSGNTMTNRG